MRREQTFQFIPRILGKIRSQNRISENKQNFHGVRFKHSGIILN